MMKHIPGLCGAILVMAAVVSAQTPQSASSTSTVIQQSDQTIVVTGCVAADTSSGRSGQRFMLSNLQSPPDRPSVDGRHAGVTSYVLTPNSDLNIGEHVGHKVEVTGFIDTASSPTAGGATGSSPLFHATSVRMLSTSCQ
jgi:hypothetical protein